MPREFPEKDQVEFSSRVPKTDYEEFAGNFPMYGASTWFIRTALAEFNKKCRENPAVIETVKASIEEMTDR